MTFPSVRELLPHEPPMIVIDAVADAGDDWVETVTRVTPEHPLFNVDDDGLPGWALIELMAQTAGVYGGLADSAGGGPVRIGYLLGTRRLELSRSLVKVNETVRVRAVREFHDPEGVGAFVCTVTSGDERVAEARLNVYQTKDTSEKGATPT